MADIVIEDGTAIADANSYASSDDLDTYCGNNGVTLASSDGDTIDASLIRASAALDGSYRMVYPGYRTLGRQQGLEWPRTAAYDYEGLVIGTNEVPREIIAATCEMAIHEVAVPGSMAPDLAAGGFIRALRAGSVSIEYTGAGYEAQPIITTINHILSSLIGSTSSLAFSGTTSRA